MGREILTVGFWGGFEKQAGFVGQMAARATGRGAAVSRLNQIRKAAPDAFKPQNLLGQIMTNPSKGFANAAARHSAAYRSPKERALRAVGYTGLGATGVGYGIHKAEQDPDYNRLKALNDRQG